MRPSVKQYKPKAQCRASPKSPSLPEKVIVYGLYMVSICFVYAAYMLPIW